MSFFRIDVPELGLERVSLDVAMYSSMPTREVMIKFTAPADSAVGKLVAVLQRKDRLFYHVDRVYIIDVYTLRLTQSQFTWVKYLFKPSK